MTSLNNTSTYKIYSTVFSQDGIMTDVSEGMGDMSEQEAAKKFFYFRHAYPAASTSLHIDGYIASTEDLAKLAKHLLG